MDIEKGQFPLELVRWLAGGNRGVSADTIVQHLTGLPALAGGYPDVPYDPGDLKRCRALLERVPELVEHFPRMRDCSPEWARLVEHWDALCALMDEEAPNWRDGQSGCPRTSARMRALRENLVQRAG